MGDIVQADSEKSSNLPKDGTVHELTSSVSIHSIDTQYTYLWLNKSYMFSPLSLLLPSSLFLTHSLPYPPPPSLSFSLPFPPLSLSSSHLQTMWFIEQLLDYSRIVGEILQGQSSFAVSSTEADRNKVLGKFLSK